MNNIYLVEQNTQMIFDYWQTNLWIGIENISHKFDRDSVTCSSIPVTPVTDFSLPRNSPLGGHGSSSSGEWGPHGLGGAQWTFLGFLTSFYLVEEIETLKDKELVGC
jgi:hypothetical protein